MLSSQKADAMIPIVSPAELAQMIQDGFQRAMESEMMKALQESGLEASSLFAEMEVDTINNGFSNMIVRTGKAMQDMQNMEQMEKSMPAQDVCDTAQLSTDVEEATCDMEEAVSEISKATAVVRKMTSGKAAYVCKAGAASLEDCKVEERPASPQEINNYNKLKATEVVNECEEISERLGRNVCTDASLNVTPPSAGIGADEYKAVMRMNELAANIEEKLPVVSAADAAMKDEHFAKMMYAKDYRKTYFKNAFLSYLNNHTLLTHGTLKGGTERKMGEVQGLDNFMRARIGNDQWLCEIANTCQGGNEAPYVGPDELDKRVAQMDAVLLFITLQQYKSSLRIERILAETALIHLDPPVSGSN